MDLVTRSQPIDAFQKETMHPNLLPGDQLLTFAQQVSFPNWNAMVGDLGLKFARRNSLEKEDANEEIITNCAFQKGVGDRNDDKRNVVDKDITERFKIVYGESQDCEGSSQPEEKQTTKIHISSVSIVLRNGQERKPESQRLVESKVLERDAKRESEKVRIENLQTDRVEEVKDSWEKVDETKMTNESKSSSPIDNDTEEINRKNVLKRLKSLEQTLNRVEEVNNSREVRRAIGTEQQTVEEDRFSSKKFGEDLMSINRMRQRLVKRSSGLDATQLTPEYSPKEEKENGDDKTHHKNRIRKKSSSFSGALPLHVDKESQEIGTPNLVERHNLAQRRRGTVDMGRVDVHKHGSSVKEKRHRHHDKKVDPSHYLMNNGKRRGSYNPTYNQCNPAVNNGKRNNSRAKSLFVCQVDERAALRDRLMKHACPELRESLERDDEESDSNHIGKSSTSDSNAHNCIEKPHDKKNHEEDENHHRIIARKAAIIPSSPKKIENDRPVFTNFHDNDHRKLGKPKGLFSNGQRRQFMRSQSNFEGVPSMYLKKLHEKTVMIEHERISRSESDSISSASSSEGGDPTDQFPLHNAARSGKVKLLLKFIADGMNVNATDAEGWPPVHYALTSGHFDCVATLLQAGANISDYTKGRTSKYFK